MKIIISLAEAKKLIREKLELSQEVEIVLETHEDSLYVKGIKSVVTVFPNHLFSEKIPAIKKLRELVPGLGLADAKVAVENPQKAIDNFVATGEVLHYS